MFFTFIAIQQGGKTKPKLIMFASLTLPANINIDGAGGELRLICHGDMESFLHYQNF